MSQRWISGREFCAKYGCTIDSLWNYRRHGYVTAAKRVGHWYYLDKGFFENPLNRDADNMPFLRGSEVATMLKISTRRVRLLVEEGKLRCRMIGHHRRYTVNQLRHYMGYRLAMREQRVIFPKVTPDHDRRAIIEWALKRLADLS